MAGAWARPCSTFIMTGWACEPGEQAGVKDWQDVAGRAGRQEGEETSEGWKRFDDVMSVRFTVRLLQWVGLTSSEDKNNLEMKFMGRTRGNEG